MTNNTAINTSHEIDNEGKFLVPLKSRVDTHGNTFYTGKLQFNGNLNLFKGQSFMVFTSEEGAEEMHVGPLHPNRAAKAKKSVFHANSKISVSLHKHKDRHDETFYVGELKGFGDLVMDNGFFFTIFTSISGREEIQITPLKIKKKSSHHENEDRKTA